MSEAEKEAVARHFEVERLCDENPGLRKAVFSRAHSMYVTRAKLAEQRMKATDMLTRATEKWNADELVDAVEKLVAAWNRNDARELQP